MGTKSRLVHVRGVNDWQAGKSDANVPYTVEGEIQSRLPRPAGRYDSKRSGCLCVCVCGRRSNLVEAARNWERDRPPRTILQPRLAFLFTTYDP